MRVERGVRTFILAVAILVSLLLFVLLHPRISAYLDSKDPVYNLTLRLNPEKTIITRRETVDLDGIFGELKYEPVVVDYVYTERDLQCMALNIYHEARGETLKGKTAVAYVTVNRVHNSRFPDNVCGVVYSARHHSSGMPKKFKCQFSWYCDSKPDSLKLVHDTGKPNIKNIRAWQESWQVAEQVLSGELDDPTHGATYYFNPALAKPYWGEKFMMTASIDNHQFYVE